MEEGRSSGVNISDVIEVIETDEMFAGAPSSNGESDSRRPRAYVKIVEQPASKALRFRYECEGRSAGSIPGVSSTPENKTYPGIQIVGHHGRAVVVVSCVTKDAPYRPHPHNLVGKEGCSRGVCTLKMNSEAITFSNLGIQCVKKKDIEEALKVREEIRVDPFRTGFAHKLQPSSIDLNSVRLCFQVFLEGPKKDEFTIPLRPIVSDPIYDKKAMSDLTICKLSDCSASVAGGKEIILLCEKVAKEDIQIRFYEERDGDLFWEAFGDFQPTQVHKQVAISFRTPKYKNIDVEKPVKVWVQLRRPSDGAVSESVPFQFVPLDSGRATFWSLRGALAKKGNYNTFLRILNENSFDGPETQKRKLDSENPQAVNESCPGKKLLLEQTDFDNKKDSLISGGNLIVVPNQNRIAGDCGSLFSDKNPREENSAKSIQMEVPPLYLEARETESKDANSTERKLDYVCGDEVKLQKAFEANESTQSFNDLISQVAELDEMYAETKEKLAFAQTNLRDGIENEAADFEESFRDNMTYTSMQMAMKNPVAPSESTAYEDVPAVRGPVIDLGRGKFNKADHAEEKLPPLPPKRVKKTPPRRPEGTRLTKALPKTPDSPKGKQNIFQRLFFRSKDSLKSPSNQNAESMKVFSGKPNGFSEENMSKYLEESKESRSREKASGKGVDGRPGNHDTLKSASHENLEKESEDYMLCKEDSESGMDLTEAENYALYTSLAPHASMTELDEISFYYSPVEKGKILSDVGEVRAKLRQIDLENVK